MGDRMGEGEGGVGGKARVGEGERQGHEVNDILWER